MKVVYKTCCGIDAHKKFLIATVTKTTKGIRPSYQKKRFPASNGDIRRLKSRPLDNDCHGACTESTGKYWVPVFNLPENEVNATIANPKWVKAAKGNKDDTKGSKRVGGLFRLGLVPGSFIPCREIRILREYTRYRFKPMSCNRSEKNRSQNAFTVCNAALDSVVSDMFGKPASAITDYLITTGSSDAETCKAFLRRSPEKKSDAVIESIDGYQMEGSQEGRILFVRAHMDFLAEELKSPDAKPDELVAPYENAVSLLCTIPGVDRPSAITLASEIGTDMSQFHSSKRLCCWAGLTPGSNGSAGKKKSVRITRAGVYPKPALVQCAHAAVLSTTSPYYRKKYERTAKRRGKKRAIIAIAGMMLTAIYHMLSNGEIWNPCDLYKLDMPQGMQEEQKEKAIRQALKLLTSEGIISSTDPSLMVS